MNSTIVNINRVLMLFLLMFSFNVLAEEVRLKVFETDTSNVKLSNDGTGIVKNIYCEGCDFNMVKITKSSKASIDGVDVGMLEARSQAGEFLTISFNPETREVRYIDWYKK